MLQQEHSAILSTYIKLQFDIKVFVLSIFVWPLKTGFTAYNTFRFVSFNGGVFESGGFIDASVDLARPGELCAPAASPCS